MLQGWMSNTSRTHSYFRGFAQAVLGCGLLLLLLTTGCQSNPLTEGAYVGSGTSASSSYRAPASGPYTTVPLVASPEVKSEARNRAEMERYTGRPVAARAVSTDDLIGWKQAGVPDSNVIYHIRTHGSYRPMTSADLQVLQNRGVSNDVIRSMQEHPYPNVNDPVPQPTTYGTGGRTYSKAPPYNMTYDNGYGTDSPTRIAPVDSGNGMPRMNGAGNPNCPGCSSGSCGVCGNSGGSCGGCSSCGASGGYYIGEPILISDGVIDTGCGCGK